jgi:hypothetical protein
MNEDKVTLQRKRAELVEKLTKPLSPEKRVIIQGDLSIINAKIKALNTTSAAQLKAEADRRRIKGLTEAQANAARARAKLGDDQEVENKPEIEDDDPAQTAAIDAWIIAVLQRGGVKVHRANDGNLDILDAPAKWIGIIDALCAGIFAAARGQELPEITEAPKARKKS